MAAVLLTVNFAEPSWDGVHAADLDVLRRTGVLRKVWPVAELPAVDSGADVWFASVGAEAGLIGHGILAGTVGRILQYGGKSWNLGVGRAGAEGGDPPGTFLLVDVDVLLPRGDEVPAEVGGGGSVRVLSNATALALRSLWSRRALPEAGSSLPVPGVLPAVALRRRADDRFEVDPDLRRTALAHRGSVCHACGLDGEQTYGEAGADIIQVHLITPPALVDEDFEPDALVDLVPLCPTCHVLVHSVAPDYSISDVRAMVRAGGYLRGSVPTRHQLDAEQAAARILEAGR